LCTDQIVTFPKSKISGRGGGLGFWDHPKMILPNQTFYVQMLKTSTNSTQEASIGIFVKTTNIS
jgi:hypothetical protein